MAYLNEDSRVSRVYSNFRGADFRGEEINLVRSPDCLNVWKDYKETESIRTRPGMELFCEFDKEVYGIWYYKGLVMAHVGKCIYRIIDNDRRSILFDDCETTPGHSFVFNGNWYFLDGRNYIYYDGEKVRHVEPYIPTTTIGRKPVGGGTKHEDVNMLSEYRKNSFLADGESKEFFLDATDIDEDYVPEVRVNGEVTTDINVDYKAGKVFIVHAPPAPLTDGQDNVVIKFKKEVRGYKDKILRCKLVQPFDNRVFFSGNDEHPNTVWHCSLDDPSYFSDLDYYREGLDYAAIRGLVAGNNALWVFREPSDSHTTVFYHTPTIDEQYGKIYPSTHSSVTIGCIGRAINFNDDIVFFSERGMEGISGDVTTEQAVAHRSSLVDRKLIAESNYRKMHFAEWEGYLMVFIDDKVYLADSRAMFTNENHGEYEWFYWQMEKPITSTCIGYGVLYLGTKDGIYSLTDNEANLESYWVTPKDKFKNPNKLKTTNKRGCVAEATGDITVYAKTEKTDFQLIGTYEDVEDYFVSRIKMKKFKDIQLKFSSNTRFSLETVTLEAFVGAYVKR